MCNAPGCTGTQVSSFKNVVSYLVTNGTTAKIKSAIAPRHNQETATPIGFINEEGFQKIEGFKLLGRFDLNGLISSTVIGDGIEGDEFEEEKLKLFTDMATGKFLSAIRNN